MAPFDEEDTSCAETTENKLRTKLINNIIEHPASEFQDDAELDELPISALKSILAGMRGGDTSTAVQPASDVQVLSGDEMEVEIMKEMVSDVQKQKREELKSAIWEMKGAEKLFKDCQEKVAKLKEDCGELNPEDLMKEVRKASDKVRRRF